MSLLDGAQNIKNRI